MSNITQHDLDQVKLITKEEYDNMKMAIDSLKNRHQEFIDWMNTSETVIFVTRQDTRLFVLNPPEDIKTFLLKKLQQDKF